MYDKIVLGYIYKKIENLIYLRQVTNIGIIRGKQVFIGDYSMKPRWVNRLKAEAKPRPFNLLSTEAE